MLLIGALVSFLGITPIVATLGVNSLLLGVVLQITGGAIPTPPRTVSPTSRWTHARDPATPPDRRAADADRRTWRSRKTVVGRRFEAVGVESPRARATGIAVQRHRFAAYVVASLAYAPAGVLLAGYVKTPGISGGDTYLLPRSRPSCSAAPR